MGWRACGAYETNADVPLVGKQGSTPTVDELEAFVDEFIRPAGQKGYNPTVFRTRRC